MADCSERKGPDRGRPFAPVTMVPAWSEQKAAQAVGVLLRNGKSVERAQVPLYPVIQAGVQYGSWRRVKAVTPANGPGF